MEGTIKVTGIGMISVMPDLTVVELTLKASDKEYDAAMAKAAEMLEKLKLALADCGFSENDIKTVSLNVNAEYEGVHEDGVYKNILTGYACIHGLRLEFGFDTKLLSLVLSRISESVTEPDLNIRFGIKDRESRGPELFRAAAEDALTKAVAIAECSGAKLGKLVSVTLESSDTGAHSSTSFGADNRCLAKAASFSMDIVPLDAVMTASVSYVWELE